tara:strand:+ start:605 stop:1438 length:834 start_codon:yes stop_codon:yes gene_type:complete
MICFRLLDSKDPAQPLADAVRALANEEATKDTYEVEPSSFRHIPNAPFAYWVSEKIRKLFVTLPTFESKDRTAKAGLCTGDDFRLVRTAWETPINEKTSQPEIWYHFAKGGNYSPFYSDIHLKVNWSNEIAAGADCGSIPGARPQNTDYYFSPGLTWPLRTSSGISLRALPQNCIFGHKGPSIFLKKFNQSKLLEIQTVMQSTLSQALITFQLAAADAAARSYEVGVIQRTVIPEKDDNRLPGLATHAWQNKRKPDTTNLTSHAFIAPALAPRTQHI